MADCENCKKLERDAEDLRSELNELEYDVEDLTHERDELRYALEERCFEDEVEADEVSKWRNRYIDICEAAGIELTNIEIEHDHERTCWLVGRRTNGAA